MACPEDATSVVQYSDLPAQRELGLTRLEAENAKLRERVVELALEIQMLQERRYNRVRA